MLPFIIFLGFSLPISIIDIKTRRIPDILSVSCFFLIFVIRLYHSPETVPLFLAASLFAFALFFCIAFGTRGLGFGDVKFAAVIGLVCGFPGILAALLTASVLALLAALFLSLLRRKRDAIPFAPFLSAGTLIAVPFLYSCAGILPGQVFLSLF